MELTKEILDLHPYLFRIAYNMIGIPDEAEDIVQDVFEKWISVDHIKKPKAYLARMVVNKAIKRLDELKAERESYIGPWLPEPYITLEPDPVPTIEYGLLFLLERLNPVERAVFILRESFSEEYSSIAELTGLTVENCRQLLHRARAKLPGTAVNKIEPKKQFSLTEAFLRALHDEDLSALNRLLRNDIELFSDGGGKRAAALKPLFGLQKVLKFLLGVMKLPESNPALFEYRPAFVNGVPAALVFRKETAELDSMQYIVADNNVLTRLLYLRNPDKLKVRSVSVQ